MTAEVAIMNKECVALAADSAGTLTSEKIFNSSNKIFRLLKGLPIGLMVFNRSEFMGVPWETIVKLYRYHLESEKKNFETLDHCVEDFTFFLKEQFCKNQDIFFKYECGTILSSICGQIYQIGEYLTKLRCEELPPEEIVRITNKVINDHNLLWSNSPYVGSINETDFIAIKTRYHEFIIETIKKIFENLPINDTAESKLEDIVIGMFTKENIENPLYSGVIFAGFGDKEIYPSQKTFIIQGLLIDKLLTSEDQTDHIDYEKTSASIRAYAQSEMVTMFMNGIDPLFAAQYNNFIHGIFTEYPIAILDLLEQKLIASNVIDKKIPETQKNEIIEQIQKIGEEEYDQYDRSFSEYQYYHFNKTILDVVGSLPKDEIALMAESLVNLTSFKRRVSMQVQSVGGPIDVAVISKKDGFVWIKRKHYFNSNLNPHFGEEEYIIRGGC